MQKSIEKGGKHSCHLDRSDVDKISAEVVHTLEYNVERPGYLIVDKASCSDVNGRQRRKEDDGQEKEACEFAGTCEPGVLVA